MKFSALAGNGMQRVSSDAAAVLFFLKKRKKRMGAQKSGRALPARGFCALILFFLFLRQKRTAGPGEEKKETLRNRTWTRIPKL